MVCASGDAIGCAAGSLPGSTFVVLTDAVACTPSVRRMDMSLVHTAVPFIVYSLLTEVRSCWCGANKCEWDVQWTTVYYTYDS